MLNGERIQIHPFTPITLFFCRQSLLVLRGHDESVAEDLDIVTDALQELKGVNGLCQGGLELDFSEMEIADFQESTENMLDFFGNYMMG